MSMCCELQEIREVSLGPRAPSRAELSKMVVETWDDVAPKALVSSAVPCGVALLSDYCEGGYSV